MRSYFFREASPNPVLGRRGLQILLLASAFAWVILVLVIGQLAYQREIKVLSDKAARDLEVHRLSLLGVAQRYKHIPYTSGRANNVHAALKGPKNQDLIDRSDVYLADINRRIGADALYLMDRQGLCISASNYREGEGSFKGEIYDFRPYFQDALAGRLGQYYAVGTTTAKPGMYFASPVHVGEDIIGVLAVKLVLSDIEKNWADAETPIVLMDRLGIVFLSSVPEYLYTATRPIAPEDLQELNRTKQYAKQQFEPTPWEMANSFDRYGRMVKAVRNGKELELLVRGEYLPDYDWTLLVSVDTREARKSSWIAMTIAVSTSLALVLGVLFWRQREKRVLELRRSRLELETRVRDRTRELSERNAFLRAMEDSLPVGIRAMDQNGTVTSMNARLCEITGYSAEDMLGRRPPFPYWHPEETQEHWHNIETTLAGNATALGYEVRFRHRMGHDIYVMIYTAPLMFSGELCGYISSMVDITQRKRAEEQHQQNVEQMRRAQYLSALGEMASTLAHEISQPLQAIAFDSAVAVRSEERANSSMLKEALGAISAQARRATDIVQRIKNPLRHSEPTPCAVNDLVRTVIGLLRPELKQKRTRVVTKFADALPTLVADRIKMEQVIQNLLMNAMQAMLDKPAVQRVITVETGLEDSSVYIRVMDQGPGIAEDKAKEIFKPFFTTKKDGIGLGLNICRSVVEDHNGRLVFQNRAEGGASFTIFLSVSA